MYNQGDWYWQLKDAKEEIYSSQQDAFIGEDDEGYVAFLSRGGVVTSIAPDDLILLRIEWLEQSVTERRRREALISDGGKAWVKSVDDKIQALRAQLNA